MFGNFEDPIDELVKEFYSNARYIGVELKCWVRGKLATLVQTETASPHTPKLQTTSTQPVPPSSQANRMTTLIKGLYQRIFGFEKFLYSTNNQVQMRITTIETQLDAI